MYRGFLKHFSNLFFLNVAGQISGVTEQQFM